MTKLLVAALLLGCVPAAACADNKPSYFENCDGYPSPTKKADGIITGSWLFGLASRKEDIRRGGYTVSTLGVSECDRALTDPALKPEYVLRRANLLQAKAFYQANNGAHDEALATLASIEQLGLDTADPLFKRGLGLGNRLLRAFIFGQTKQSAQALAEIEAIERERPYGAGLRDTTMKLRLMVDSGLENHIQLLRELAPINPIAAFDGFYTALAFGRFDDAVQFAAGLSLDLPRTRGNWTVEGETEFEYRRIELQAEFDGALSYVLLAEGDVEGSGRRLVAAKERLDVAMAPPPPPPEGRALKKSVQRDFDQRVAFGNKGLEALERWRTLMILRTDAPQLDGQALFARISHFPPGSVPVLPDLLSRLGREQPAAIEEAVREFLAIMHEERIRAVALNSDEFLSLLPRPEIPATQVKLKRAGDGYFLSDSGYSRREMDGPDDWTIRFTDDLASAETVEEFGLLAAAEETVKRGYDGFLIQSRRVLERVTNLVSYGSVVDTTNSGREAQLRIRMVRGSDRPGELAGTEWRVLRPKEIIAGLDGLPTRE